jgi:dihydroorotate dehydrogenase (NAD+) catalytic subunit
VSQGLPSGRRLRRGRGERPGRASASATALDTVTTLGPVVLRHPIVAASGTYGHGAEVARLGRVDAIGAVTVKSLSAFPWKGNAPPRVHEVTAGMVNAIGLDNPGVEHWIAHGLPELEALGVPVIASVWGRTAAEFAAAARALAPVADRLAALEVNASCPNLEDRSRVFAHSTAATREVVGAVVAEVGALAVLAKLSPNAADLPDIAGAALDAGAVALTLVNTVLGLAIDVERRRPVLGNGGGGLSGPAIHPVALRAVHDVARAHPGVPIVGTGGVTTGLDAVAMLLAGASAVGVGTASFRDPAAPARIAAELATWCARHGVARTAELVGGLRP